MALDLTGLISRRRRINTVEGREIRRPLSLTSYPQNRSDSNRIHQHHQKSLRGTVTLIVLMASMSRIRALTCPIARRQLLRISEPPKWRMATDSRQLRFLGGCLSDQFMPLGCSKQSLNKNVVLTTIEPDLVLQPCMQYGDAILSHLTRHTISDSSSASSLNAARLKTSEKPPRTGFGASIRLTEEERRLFSLLRQVREGTNLSTTLRVAGGWVRDKLLATPEFQAYHKVFQVGGQRLTSKFQKPSPSLGRQGTKVLVSTDDQTCAPVDIDIALDDMLGREFADHLNDYLTGHGEDSVSVGVVLKNPEKSKHLETATMKIDSFWIDFVNLRAEEYTQESRIPDLMRIGTAAEDSFRRDLTINSLFYNINTGQVEDWTGRGFDDLRKGIVATPLAPLTTLLDDPLRVLRSVRFAARLHFTMDGELKKAARDSRVKSALAHKVSRERIGGEVDLMLRSPDPVGAMRLLINLNLADTVFPLGNYVEKGGFGSTTITRLLSQGLDLLAMAHEHLADCRLSPPLWCVYKNSLYSDCEEDLRLIEDDEARRLLWYAAFLKPFYDYAKQQEQFSSHSEQSSRKSKRSVIQKLLVDDLKRPVRDADAVERIIKASNEMTQLVDSGCDVSATMVLLSEVRITKQQGTIMCTMGGRTIATADEEDPLWVHAMELRLLCSKTLLKIGPLWRAPLVLSIAEELVRLERDGLEYSIEGDFVDENQLELRAGVLERFDTFATALQHLGLIGIWHEKPALDGADVKKLLHRIPRGPAFRAVMDEQLDWMVSHPGAPKEALQAHLLRAFPDYAP